MHGNSKVDTRRRRHQDNCKRVLKNVESVHEEEKVPNKTLLALGIRIAKLNDGITSFA